MTFSEKISEVFTGLILDRPQFWIDNSDILEIPLNRKLDKIKVVSPVYVMGLAMSGTTITTEILASSPDFATHQYQDYPAIFFPYYASKLNAFFAKFSSHQPVERTHKDGLMVTPNSPESMEEIIWSAFFEDLHDVSKINILEADINRNDFRRFYVNHIKQIILARGKSRYLSKGNYNLTRTGYISSMFPDAKFVIIVRSPLDHIASMIKQDALFSNQAATNPKTLQHLEYTKHYEFGIAKKPIITSPECFKIVKLFSEGANMRAWAKYWAEIHKYIMTLTNQKNVYLLKYNDLLKNPGDTISCIMEFLNASGKDDIIRKYENLIKAPAYYNPVFTKAEMRIVEEETGDIYSKLGC